MIVCWLTARRTAAAYVAGPEPIKFELRGRTVEIRGISRSVEPPSNVAFVATGFASLDEAGAFGELLQGAAQLLSNRLRLGLDVAGAEPADEQKDSVEDDTHGSRRRPRVGGPGVTVYESDGLEFIGMTGTRRAATLTAYDKLQSHLIEVCQLEPPLHGSRRALACDLVRMSDADEVSRNRFVLLVTALECLLVDKPLPTALQRLIDDLLSAYDLRTSSAGHDADTTASLRSRLAGLKRSSVRQSLKELVPSDDFAFVDECYGIRSRLVHGQNPPPIESELRQNSERLRSLVVELIESTS
jgi:hypothetical protein